MKDITLPTMIRLNVLVFIIFFLISSMIYSQDVKIHAVFDSCITNSKGILKFNIINDSNKEYWLNAWNLWYCLKIKDSNETEIMPNCLIEDINPNIDQFILLKPHVETKLELEVDFFSRFPLEQDKIYYLEICYYNSLKKKKSNTVLGKISIDPIKFELCK